LALTLAGVTGIVVSFGLSVDSNVVLFETIKEDIRKGRSIRSAADRSFTAAWGTIVKADTASLIVAALLYALAVGPVRGFAFYLGLATLLDLFASWFFMRPSAALSLRSGLCARHPRWFALPVPSSGNGRDAGSGRDAENKPSVPATAEVE
jgi:preprotein translocase subunit SecD